MFLLPSLNLLGNFAGAFLLRAMMSGLPEAETALSPGKAVRADERGLGSAIRSVERRAAVLLIACLPVIITSTCHWSGRPRSEAACRVPGAALEPIQIDGLITDKLACNKHRDRADFFASRK